MTNQALGESLGRYTSLEITGFRAFEHLELKNLALINLFFGPNNAGKSSILESVFTHACGYNFDPFLRRVVLKRSAWGTSPNVSVLDLGEQLLNIFRDKTTPPYTFQMTGNFAKSPGSYKLAVHFEPGPVIAELDPRALGEPAELLYADFSEENESGISTTQVREHSDIIGPEKPKPFLGTWEVQVNAGEKERLDLYIPLEISRVSPLKLAAAEDILDHRNPAMTRRIFAHLKRYRALDEFVKRMHQVFDEVVDIDAIPYPDGSSGPVVVTTQNGEQRPLYVFGDGMQRWYHLLGRLLVYRQAIHCIEEIDATFHPASQPDLARWLVKDAYEYRNQLFMTSHSMEFLDAFLTALYAEEGHVPSGQDPVQIYTLLPSQSGDQLEVWSRSGREAFEDRQKYGMELRGQVRGQM